MYLNQANQQREFLCIQKNIKPTVISPEESRDVVYAMKMAEKSALENRIINFKEDKNFF